jgi:hypothetical protein
MATSNEQLDAMRGLGENWDGYGAAATQAKVIDLAQEFTGLLEAILRKSGTPTPELHVSPTRSGGVLIEWEHAGSEHEVELKPDGSIGFLHHRKETGQIETREFAASAPTVVDPGLLQELRELIAA